MKSLAPSIVVVDDFLDNPDAIRKLALAQTFEADDRYYKGKRSRERFLREFDHRVFARLLYGAIDNWEHHAMSGRFQFCVPSDPLVYHADGQTHAGTIYLTPDAPPESGLSLWRSKVTGVRRPSRNVETDSKTFDGNLLDPTKWELVDKIGNVYNRLVLWDATMIHSASCYFGNALPNARLFWMFFFDIKR
jgi:hypothetical protein